ncbi:heme oxygenase (biliverdin-producing) [Acaryochloris sp. CCMEE 5410]|uniref:biliverdin-producing heme oxygenase n=1 Tax=Acaryochloris sp. CCMEE 5410 TaxID=310037 RepID=UPI0002FC055E|nr:heme oxygenase (biliverdin-producing) [Acaryochloris sp. CCMEE 5410]KAI9129328.1 heme oxygenase (biliverdin-producing) [Acaryochloris sp. CCMEE 5410]
MASNLASRLRDGTQQSHTTAENTAFMKCVLKGIVVREPFGKLLANLYYVYSTLEEVLQRHQNHAVVGAIYFPELNRTTNLEQDLAFYYGEQWRDLIQPSKAGLAYVKKIRDVAAHSPELLVAHAYVRYLGDLSGGQSLKKIIRTALELPPGKGTGLYEFERLPTLEARRMFKAKYRDTLNSLPLNQATIQRIVLEANVAFEFNREVMLELEAEVKAEIGEPAFDLVTRQGIPGSTVKTALPAVELIDTE